MCTLDLLLNLLLLYLWWIARIEFNSTQLISPMSLLSQYRKIEPISVKNVNYIVTEIFTFEEN